MRIKKEKVMKDRRFENNDFLIGLNLDHATDEQKIALLNRVIDNELNKPADEVDMSLVEECMAFIDDIDAGRFTKTDGQLYAALQKIMFESEQKKVPASVQNAAWDYKRIVKYIGGIAAVLVLLLVSVTLTARINGYHNAYDWIVAQVGDTSASPDERPSEAIILYKGDEATEYDSIEALLQAENLNVLYPASLPQGTKIESLKLTTYEEGQFDLSFSFNSLHISFSVCNFNLSDYVITSEEALTLSVNGHTFTVGPTPDGKFHANYVTDQYAYRLTCTDYDELLNMIEHLKSLDN